MCYNERNDINNKELFMDNDPTKPSTNEGQTPPVGAEPVAAPAEKPVAAAEPTPVSEPVVKPSEPVASAAEPEKPATPATTSDTAEAKPKKKTGLFIVLIIGILALVGGGVAAAVLLLGGNKGGTIDGAMEKLASNNAYENINAAGTVNVEFLDESVPVKNAKLSINTTISPKTLTNKSVIDLTVGIADGASASIKLEDIVTPEHDIYVKASGLKDLLKNDDFVKIFLPSTVIDCLEDADASAACSYYGIDEDSTASDFFEDSELAGVAELIDNEWLLFSHEKIEEALGQVTNDDNKECVSKVEDYFNNGKIIDYYKNNAFVTATTEGVTKPSKSYPVQKLNLDATLFASFFKAVMNSAEVKDIFGCFNVTNYNTSIDEDRVKEAFDVVPTLYVEIDNDNNITRFLTDKVETPVFAADADFVFSYPTNFKVEEPSEYKDAFKIIESAL